MVVACTVHTQVVRFQLRTKVGVLRRDFRSLERFVKIQLQGKSLWEHISLGVRTLFTRRRCLLHFCVKVSKEIGFSQKLKCNMRLVYAKRCIYWSIHAAHLYCVYLMLFHPCYKVLVF